jgi:DNA-binding MarR family transcriptional regulator
MTAINPTREELESVAALRMALRRFLNATDAVTAAHGLTPRQYDLLAVLHSPSEEAGLTSTTIADRLGLSRSATTELVTRASTAGLIVRSGDEDDARMKHVAPTPEGTRRFHAAVVELRTERYRLLALLRVAAGLAAALTAAG